MTTKKQRRERVAEKRRLFDAETKRLGLVAQARARDQRKEKLSEAELRRADRQKQDSGPDEVEIEEHNRILLERNGLIKEPSVNMEAVRALLRLNTINKLIDDAKKECGNA